MTDADDPRDAEAARGSDGEGGDGARGAGDGVEALPAWFPDPVLVVRPGPSGPVVVGATPAFERAFGDGPVADRPLAAVLSERLGDSDPVLAALEDGPGAASAPVRPAGAEAPAFSVRVVEAGDDDRRYLLFADVTDLADRLDDLRAERDRLSSFASVVAHDVRNPLSTARMRLRAARDTGEAVHFEKVRRAIDRADSIIEDALGLVRDGRLVGETEPVGLGRVVDDAWETVDADRAELSVADELGTVEADPGPLRELLENLFRNAVQHGGSVPDSDGSDPGQGGVDDGPRGEAGRRVAVTVARTPDGFVVADDGPGVPESERENVLEPGYSTGDSTGLGLAIVDRIAGAHGWTVTVGESDAGGLAVEVSGVERVDDR